jgi:hypothetical protein
MNAFQDASREAQSFLADSAVKYYGEAPPAHDRVEVRFACGGQAQVHMSLLCRLSPDYWRKRVEDEAFKKEAQVSGENGALEKTPTIQMSMADFALIRDLWVCLVAPRKLPDVQSVAVSRIMGLLIAADYCGVCLSVMNYLVQDVQRRLKVADCVAVARDAGMAVMPPRVLHLVLPTLLECPAALKEAVVANAQIAAELHELRAHRMPHGLHWLTCEASAFHMPEFELALDGGALVLREATYTERLRHRISVHATVPLNAHCVVLQMQCPLYGNEARLVCVDTRAGALVGQPVQMRWPNVMARVAVNDTHLFVEEVGQITIYDRDTAVFTDARPPRQTLEFEPGQASLVRMTHAGSDSLVLWYADSVDPVVYKRDARDGEYTRRYSVPIQVAPNWKQGRPDYRSVADGLWLSDTLLLLVVVGESDWCSLQLFDQGRPVGDAYLLGRCVCDRARGLRHLFGRIYFARHPIYPPNPDPAMVEAGEYASSLWVFDPKTLTRVSVVPYPKGANKAELFNYGPRMLVLFDWTRCHVYDPAIGDLLHGHFGMGTGQHMVPLDSGAIVLVHEAGEIGVMTRRE